MKMFIMNLLAKVAAFFVKKGIEKVDKKIDQVNKKIGVKK